MLEDKRGRKPAWRLARSTTTYSVLAESKISNIVMLQTYRSHSACQPLKVTRDIKIYKPSYVWLFYNCFPWEFPLQNMFTSCESVSADKTACGQAGWSLPLCCQHGKHQWECLWAVGRTWTPHAVQTRGFWMPWSKKHRAVDHPSLPPPTRTHTNTCMHRLLHRHVLLFIRVRQRCLTLINSKRNPKVLDIND